MRRETPTAPLRTMLPQGYVMTHAETEEAIVEAIQQLQSAGLAELALVTIHLRYHTTEKNGRVNHRAGELAEQGVAYLLQSLRPLVRKTDHVFQHGHSMHIILLAANLQGVEIVEERLWEALLWRIHSMSEQELPRPASVRIGHSALPRPQATPAELFSAAQATSRHFGERIQRTCQRNVRASLVEDDASSNEEEEIPLLAKRLGIPYLPILPSSPPQRVRQAISASLAQELRCYPVGRERNILTVAMLNPQDQQALERLRRETGLLIFPVLTHPEVLESALKHLG